MLGVIHPHTPHPNIFAVVEGYIQLIIIFAVVEGYNQLIIANVVHGLSLTLSYAMAYL